ncbi:MAG: class I SAM-dependent methyltransferase [Candidatus Thorarchaeota archaeon]
MYRGVVKHLLTKVCIPEATRVLQIGPGPDWIGIWLDMIRVARMNGACEGFTKDTIKYVTGVVEDLSCFNDDTFDFVFSNESLHHWVDPAQAFKEIHRVLKEIGGVCILDDYRDLGFRERLIVEVVGRVIAGKWHKWWKSSIDASYTMTEIEELLQLARVTEWNVSTEFLGLRIEKLPVQV